LQCDKLSNERKRSKRRLTLGHNLCTGLSLGFLPNACAEKMLTVIFIDGILRISTKEEPEADGCQIDKLHGLAV